MIFRLAAWGALLLLARPADAQLDTARIANAMTKVADWQLQHLKQPPAAMLDDPHGWSEAVFWLGMTALADRQPHYRDRVMALGADMHWQLGKRTEHADDHLIGQVWLWGAQHGAGPDVLQPMRARIDTLMTEQASAKPAQDAVRFPKCAIRLCWCDALFMSPPTLLGLSRVTGDGRYAELAFREVDQAITLLYDPEQRLFHRDDRFIGQRDGKGRRIFWSRGNGWALAGFANMLAVMDRGDPHAAFYKALFGSMAERVRKLQRKDGAWSSSLLDPGQSPETSGTGLFVYALAWGVNAGLLDRDRFMPTIERGWAALDRAVAPEGAIGGTQPISDQPGAPEPGQSQPYGAGAFLLAGNQLLILSDPTLRQQR